MVSFIEIKRINACIYHLEQELDDVPECDKKGLTKAIELLKE